MTLLTGTLRFHSGADSVQEGTLLGECDIDIDNEQLRKMMRSVPYFSSLDESTFEYIMQSVQLRRFPAGSTLFLRDEGHGSAPFYLVVEGTVRVYVSSLRGREQVLRHFHPGDTFGEVPLFDGGAYPASADTLTDVVLAVLPRAQFLQLMKENPEFTVGIINVMAGRLRHFNKVVEDLSLRRVISRVANLLVEEQASELTQAQMAAMIGASREMVNRSLHSLEDDGIIELAEGGRIIICNPDRLTAVIEQG